MFGSLPSYSMRVRVPHLAPIKEYSMEQCAVCNSTHNLTKFMGETSCETHLDDVKTYAIMNSTFPKISLPRSLLANQLRIASDQSTKIRAGDAK